LSLRRVGDVFSARRALAFAAVVCVALPAAAQQTSRSARIAGPDFVAGEAHVELALAPLLWSSSALPARIGVSHRTSVLAPFDVEAHSRIGSSSWFDSRLATTDAFYPSWSSRFGTTSIFLSQTESRSLLLGDAVDFNRVRSVDLQQSIRVGPATASATLAYDTIDHLQPTQAAEARYRPGVGLRLALGGLPDVATRAELAFSRVTPADGEPYDARHWRVTMGLDFTKFLPEEMTRRSATLGLWGVVGDTDGFGPELNRGSTVESAVVLTGKIRF
jgi:hypothetical protein